jgi:L-amino acid N-acyltransferase YncA
MSLRIKVTKAHTNLDSQDIANLIEICRKEKRTVLDYHTAQEEAEYLKKIHPRDAVFVARIDGTKFAGFAGIARRWPYSKRLQHCGEVGTWVMPDCRRRGVGIALWRDGILPWCEKHRFMHLGFFIMVHNKEGIGFYENMGFRVCGYHRRLVNWDGQFLDAVEMEMSLKTKDSRCRRV